MNPLTVVCGRYDPDGALAAVTALLAQAFDAVETLTSLLQAAQSVLVGRGASVG